MRHGATVVDDYYWLREKSNPEVTKYLEAENAYTEAETKHLKPFEDALYKEMLSHIKQTDLSVPVRRSGYLYYSRTEEGKQYPIQCRRKGSMDSPEEVLLDLNELANGRKFVGLGAFSVSDDQNLLAYTLDYSGFRQYKLQVKDLRSGQTMPDTTERVTSVEWAADNKTLFLTTEDAVTKRSDKLWRHVLGSTQFEPVYEEKDELYDIGVDKTRDKKYLLLGSESKDTTEFRYLRADRAADNFAIFLPREKKRRYYIDHREGRFYIRTNKDGKNFEVMTTPENDIDVKNWSLFVPPQEDVLIEGLDLFKNFAVLVEKTEAVTRLRVHNFETGSWTAISFPEPVYSAFPGETRDYDSTTYRYNYQSFVTPQSVYDYDTQTGQSKLLKRQEVPGGYDPSQYVSERLWATARDGVKVPLSIVYKKGFRRDGESPLFLYGYGSYGYATPVTFD
ncbi:MAG: S9 family peptidase, partial [Acidobacteriaceae bacterium]|nr:S9 family peptidase [Acidobacteriaceae bacterium]